MTRHRTSKTLDRYGIWHVSLERRYWLFWWPVRCYRNASEYSVNRVKNKWDREFKI